MACNAFSHACRRTLQAQRAPADDHTLVGRNSDELGAEGRPIPALGADRPDVIVRVIQYGLWGVAVKARPDAGVGIPDVDQRSLLATDFGEMSPQQLGALPQSLALQADARLADEVLDLADVFVQVSVDVTRDRVSTHGLSIQRCGPAAVC